jgi:hypothetical protein
VCSSDLEVLGIGGPEPSVRSGPLPTPAEAGSQKLPPFAQ